ncbi:MAG: hypothetical protein RLZZ494_171 [Pseudomonadota bacterium]|jgi:hypothetical protein
MMTLEQIRLRTNPVLQNLLLGVANDETQFLGSFLLPELPQALTSVMVPKMGDAALRRYNLRRAPGGPTKRVDINWEGTVYSVKQDSVDIPIPRELVRESEGARTLNIGLNIPISTVAMTTAKSIIMLAYELDCADLLTNTANYPVGNSLTLAGATKWSAATGTPVTDINTAAEVVRQKVGRRPQKLGLSAMALAAIRSNPEVKGYLPANHMGPATLEELKVIFNVREIKIGEAIWKDADGVAHDVWGADAVLSFAPTVAGNNVSLATPTHGFTNTIEGHPMTEPPRYEDKCWIYGVTYERQPNIATPGAAFLFKNVA